MLRKYDGARLFVLFSVLLCTKGFFTPCSQQTSRSRLQSATTDRVDQLLQLVQQNPQNDASIRRSVLELSKEETLDEKGDLFEPLLGNYNVSCTLPNEPSERPVGGKWNSRLFSIQQTWQHLVPATANKTNSVAQAVNVIVLKALFWTIHVILRGDAFALPSDERESIAAERQTPDGLSVRTVRADFDPPRIVVSGNSRNKARKGRLCLSLGPPSSVILDTPYCDNRVRIGKGSKGSRFVFVRSQDPRADEWKELVKIKPVGKRQLLAFFGLLSLAGVGGAWKLTRIGRWVSLLVAFLSVPSTLAIARSTGGIVENRKEDLNPGAAP